MGGGRRQQIEELQVRAGLLDLRVDKAANGGAPAVRGCLIEG